LASYTANLAAFMITKEEFFDLQGINDPKVVDQSNKQHKFVHILSHFCTSEGNSLF